MIDLLLYTRRECHLCDDMKKTVDRESRGFPVRLSLVDVDSRPELAERYGEDVPVLFLDGRKFAKHRLPAGRLRERLRRGAAAAASEGS